MANYILMVFEGESTEEIIFDSLRQYYLKENPNTIVYGFHCSEIYSLYHKIDNDEDLELFPLLQEKLVSQNTDLQNISRSEVSEIYMFFDYDGHASAADDDKLKYMLEFFNNETENGKLYISYPMVEAIKHIGINIDYKNLCVEAKENIKYKSIVSDCNDEKYKNPSSFSEEDWEYIVEINGRKIGYILEDNYKCLCRNIEQSEIFRIQIEKYINTNNVVSVLSSFPVFLLDYYGYKYFGYE